MITYDDLDRFCKEIGTMDTVEEVLDAYEVDSEGIAKFTAEFAMALMVQDPVLGTRPSRDVHLNLVTIMLIGFQLGYKARLEVEVQGLTGAS